MRMKAQMRKLMGGVKSATFGGFHTIEKDIGRFVAPQRKRVDFARAFSKRINSNAFAFEQMNHVFDGFRSQSPVLAHQRGGDLGALRLQPVDAQVERRTGGARGFLKPGDPK